MQSIRRGLRLWVATWLVLQVASLSALVPRDCCAAHRPGGKRRKAHVSPEGRRDAVSDARGQAARPAPCTVAATARRPTRPRDDCAMRGTCSGPMAALFAQLSNYGVLPATLQVLPDVRQGAVTRSSDEQLLTRLASPDSPPPRA